MAKHFYSGSKIKNLFKKFFVFCFFTLIYVYFKVLGLKSPALT